MPILKHHNAVCMPPLRNHNLGYKKTVPLSRIIFLALFSSRRPYVTVTTPPTMRAARLLVFLHPSAEATASECEHQRSNGQARYAIKVAPAGIHALWAKLQTP